MIVCDCAVQHHVDGEALDVAIVTDGGVRVCAIQLLNNLVRGERLSGAERLHLAALLAAQIATVQKGNGEA